jgi:hypothetical protein
MPGMLFIFFGMLYHTLLDADARFAVPENHGRERNQTTCTMKERADVGLEIVRQVFI